MNRREFVLSAALPCAAFTLGSVSAADSDSRFIVEAKYYEKLAYKKIKCKLCPRECVIDDRERGYCGVRENRGSTYYSLVHSRVVAAHVDPIEKKPFFHFLPGSAAFSIATAGCNVNCKMCQNWEISQVRPEQVRSNYLPPRDLAGLARRYECRTIAYTYSEPVIFYEYLLDCADAAHAVGVRSAVVTGGFVQQEPLREMCRHVDAVKVDLKAFSQKFYKEVVNGDLKPVLDVLVTLRKQRMWCEIVYLVIPTLNDGDQDLKGLARWVRTDLGPDVPLHFSRFHPEYLLKNLPPTPLETLERAKSIADAEGLRYVYLGNVPGHPAESTYCPKCRKAVVERIGYTIKAFNLKSGKCRYCSEPIPGIW